MSMHSQTHRERDRNRVLLFFYDLLVFLTCFTVIFLLHLSVAQPFPPAVICFNVALSAVCLFGFRFLFRVYRQIWRYGDPAAFGRLLAADLIGGAIYAFSIQICKRYMSFLSEVAFLRCISLVGANLILAMIVRILYFLLCKIARESTPAGRLVNRLLRTFALTDLDSEDPDALLRIVLAPAAQSSEPINDLLRIARQFAIRGEITSISQINKGYINRTYRVETRSETGHTHMYTLQRINTNVFPDVDALMDNFAFVTDHLHGRLRLPGASEEGSVQKMHVTKDGRAYFRDDTGCWRMMTYFDGVYSLDIPDFPETFRHAGHAFGMFIREMSDVETDRIHTVIPNFHNTLSRYLDLERAIAADPVGRVRDVQSEIAFVRAHKSLFDKISAELESGRIPLRICHNDCNLNNLLFDNETHLPAVIIDLDTVMPSSPLYDYGDSMRIGTNTAADDEKDLSKVSCDLALYEQYARGFLEACGDLLTRRELELLPYAAPVITSEDGIRFLMDHINGDTYYNIYYPGQNLDRARTQLRLLADMESKLPEIREILRRIYREYGLEANLNE